MVDIALDQFIEMLGQGVVAHAHYVEQALREAIGHVHEAAVRMIGDERPEWPPLAQRTRDERWRLGFPENEPLLRTGHLLAAIETEVELHPVGGDAVCGVKDGMVGDGSRADPVRNIGDVAVWMELGTGHIPARSFLAQAAIDKEREILEALGSDVIKGLFDPTGRPVPGSSVV
jgi:hypothetical protein